MDDKTDIKDRVKKEIENFYSESSEAKKSDIIEDLFNIEDGFYNVVDPIHIDEAGIERFYDAIIIDHLFSKESYSQKDISFLKHMLISGDIEIIDLCEEAIEHQKENFVELVLGTPELRKHIKVENAIHACRIKILKRIYLECFEWNEQCDRHFSTLKLGLTENPSEYEHCKETLTFLEEHVSNWRNGINNTDIKPAKSK